jgi:Flp pilus assembly protein TadB
VSLIVALIAGAAAWWSLPATAEPRLRNVVGIRGIDVNAAAPPTARSRGRGAWWAAGCAAAAALALWPGALGLGLATVCLVVVPRVIGRLESRRDRRQRELLGRQAPALVDLLAATLASGAPMRSALAAVSAAVDDPARSAVGPVVAALDLGADASLAWQHLADDPVLSPVVTAVVRSERTGAPLATLLAHLAADLRRAPRATVEIAARSAGVRAVLPLAACFLPAFLLLGVVPVVAALAASLLGS